MEGQDFAFSTSAVLPSSNPGLWVIGLFVGIDQIFYGCAWITLALGLLSNINADSLADCWSDRCPGAPLRARRASFETESLP